MNPLRLLYLALGSATASLMPFIVVILSNRGMDAAAIGIVTGMGALGLVIAMAFWGHLGDRVLGRRKTVRVCTLAAILVAIGIGLPVPLVLLAALTIAFNCTHGALTALCDALTVNTLRDPHRQYGQIRLMASLSFGVAIIVFGLVYDALGYEIASVFYLAAALCLIAATLGIQGEVRARRAADGPAETDRMPSLPASVSHPPAATVAAEVAPAGAEGRVGRRSRLGSTGMAFRVQPRLLPVLATVAITWSAIIVSFGFLSLRIVALGGKASDVALSFGVSAFLEIPGMIMAARLASHIGLRGLFCLSAFAFGVVFLSWSVLTSPLAIIGTRVFTGLAYGSMSVAMVLTIGHLLPGTLQATGQALFQGTAMGLASVVGNVVGGFLYGGPGAPVLFLVCASLCGIGGALALITLPGRVQVRA